MPSPASRSSHQATTCPGAFSWKKANTVSADDALGSQVAAALALTRSGSITVESWLDIGTDDKMIGGSLLGGTLDSHAPTAGSLPRTDLVNNGAAPSPWYSNAPMSIIPFTMRGKPSPRWSQSVAWALLPASMAGLPGSSAIV